MIEWCVDVVVVVVCVMMICDGYVNEGVDEGEINGYGEESGD